MRAWQFVVAGILAATVLSVAATETQRWTHVACDYSWVIWQSGDRYESTVSNIYRFDTNRIERWIPGSRAWNPECDPATGGFTEASCTVTDSSVSAVRRQVTESGETVRLDSFGINRMTAAFTAHFEVKHGPGGDASGSCRATDDPSAGMRRQF